MSVVGLIFAAGSHSSSDTATTRFLEAGGGFGGTVDETASAHLAASIAQAVELAVAEEISASAQTASIGAYSTVTSDAYLAKAYTVATSERSYRDIENYTVKSGDTISKLAEKFGITSNTIRWANDIDNGVDALSVGTVLTIPPVSGVLHTVQAGDSPDKLAETYQASARSIVSFNDAELDGLEVGATIVIPDGTRPAPVTPQVPVRTAASLTPVFGGNGYSYGYCTWHVANRRADIGQSIPTNWGNAISWRYNAAASGYTVSSTPVVGAVAYELGVGGLGHVAFVEAVRPNGNVYLSDMNYPYWGVMTYREVSPDRFLYIY